MGHEFVEEGFWMHSDGVSLGDFEIRSIRSTWVVRLLVDDVARVIRVVDGSDVKHGFWSCNSFFTQTCLSHFSHVIAAL